MMNVKDLLLTICIILLYLPNLNSFRILGFFPMPGKSQHNIFAPILHQLAVKGHHVVYVSGVKPSFTHPNLEVRLVDILQEKVLEDVDLETLNDPPPFIMTCNQYNTLSKSAPYIYGSSVVQELIHSENETFDAVALESFLMQEPSSAFLHKFSCPAIEISTFGSYAWLNELAGLSDNIAFQSDVRADLPDKMTFWQRLYNYYAKWSYIFAGYYSLMNQQKIMDHYFNYTGWESRPSIFELVSNRSIILVNQDVVLGQPLPLPPHVKDIGGVNIQPRRPLPENLKKWMDEAKDGVIYFSLGSNLRTSDIVRNEFGEAFIRVFQNLPQRIIMKWEKDELPEDMPSNILFYKWVPQLDVLAHKHCRVFITHGGFLSLVEAVHYGVPLLGIPFFWDQPKNILLAESFGYGLKLNKNNVTYESVRWALNELLTNERYRKEALRRSQIIQERRHTAIDEAVFWIEQAIKHPNSLTPQAAHFSFIKLHAVDVKIFIILVLIIFYKTFKFLIFNIRAKYSNFDCKIKKD